MTTARALARLSGYTAAWLLVIACCWALIPFAFVVGIVAAIVHETRKHRYAKRVARLAALHEYHAATDDLMALADVVQNEARVFDLDEIRRLRQIAAADAAEVTR